jgi:hypothetical protein
VNQEAQSVKKVTLTPAISTHQQRQRLQLDIAVRNAAIVLQSDTRQPGRHVFSLRAAAAALALYVDVQALDFLV